MTAKDVKFGDDARHLKNTTVMLHELPGDHHFNEDYARVAEAALDGMAKRPGSLSE
jgi:type IV secretory pathway VirJ component